MTWGKQVFNCQAAIAELAKQGISAQLVDLRSIRPLDEETLYTAVARTGNCVIVHEGHLFAGIGAEIAARVQEACFDNLKAPVLRVASRDVPHPYATNLENLVVPDVKRILAAVTTVTGR